MVHNGLNGFENWINGSPDEFFYVKIYNKHFTSRGQGDPFIRFKAIDKENLIDQVYEQISSIESGKFTIAICDRESGGSPLKYHGKFLSNSVAGTSGKSDSFSQIGGIAGYMDLRDKNMELKFENRLLTEKNESLQYQVDNPEGEPFYKEMIRKSVDDPVGTNQMMSGIANLFVAPIVAAFKSPQAYTNINGNNNSPTVSSIDVEVNDEIPIEENNPYNKEAMTEFVQAMIRVHQTYFPNKSIVEVANALEATLKLNPALAQMIFK